MTIFSYPEILTKYGNMVTFLEYYGILEAIPQSWKQIIRNNQGTQTVNDLSFFDHFKQKLRCTSAIYN